MKKGEKIPKASAIIFLMPGGGSFLLAYPFLGITLNLTGPKLQRSKRGSHSFSSEVLPN